MWNTLPQETQKIGTLTTINWLLRIKSISDVYIKRSGRFALHAVGALPLVYFNQFKLCHLVWVSGVSKVVTGISFLQPVLCQMTKSFSPPYVGHPSTMWNLPTFSAIFWARQSVLNFHWLKIHFHRSKWVQKAAHQHCWYNCLPCIIF